MPPKISVLVPVFNGERYLAECLDSILAQDFCDYELLVSDNCSTDGTRALIESYAARDPRIRWWRNATNLGMTANFNQCLRAAQGEYVKYVLHDDKLMAPLALRRLVEVMDKHPSVSLVAADTQFIDADSRPLQRRHTFPRSGLYDGRQVIVKCFEGRDNLIGEPSIVMFRRKQPIREFNNKYRFAVDLEMWLHLLEQGDFAYVAEPLCAFRKHPDQESVACRRDHCHRTEYPELLAGYIRQPWLRAAFSKRGLFGNLYSLRKLPEQRQSPLAVELLDLMGARWHALYWLEHKLIGPVRKLLARTRRAFRKTPL